MAEEERVLGAYLHDITLQSDLYTTSQPSPSSTVGRTPPLLRSLSPHNISPTRPPSPKWQVKSKSDDESIFFQENGTKLRPKIIKSVRWADDHGLPLRNVCGTYSRSVYDRRPLRLNPLRPTFEEIYGFNCASLFFFFMIVVSILGGLIFR
jgi:hypothetical protein